METVTVIRRTGRSALVEYQTYSGPRRATVPVSAVVNGCVDSDDLRQGVEYGVPWEDVLNIRVTPGELGNALRKAGIWTAADAAANPKAVQSALLTVTTRANGIIEAARKFEANKETAS
jgi:hypothetical protein